MESKDQTSFGIPSLIPPYLPSPTAWEKRGRPPLPPSTAREKNHRGASKNRLLSSTEITKQSSSIAKKAKQQPFEEGLKKRKKAKKQSSSALVPSMMPCLSPRPERGSRSPRKCADDPETSPKRLKTENGYTERRSDLDIGKSKPDESGQDRRESKSRIESSSERKGTESHKSSLLLSRASLGSTSLIKPNKLKPASAAMTSKDSISGKESGATGQNGLSSRLSRTGLSGKAERVDPGNSMFYESESEQDTECFSETSELTDTMAANSTRDVSNLEFLPLVYEDNILRVNRIAYMKLSVIGGKGGSCKVYRALSGELSEVAIKKVKLAGMDEKAIAGYANEISLLKRLSGNPAIIQMNDSEVDLERNSIFVVMELGERDLNYDLKKLALLEKVNMTFIETVWQQMLVAVHSIHEERIIHGDLKPANFLIVRGCLKLTGFGIAKANQSDDTTSIYCESHIGTLNYMSPEAIFDTGSGQNGPGMKIGRVRMNNSFLLRLTLFFSKLCLHCRLPMFGLLVVFSMKWCTGRLRLQTLTFLQRLMQL
jgi:serine/threonine-protein kinase RIO1